MPVPEAAFLRGIDPSMQTYGQPTSYDPTLVGAVATKTLHLYIGELQTHYGHFLISTLSRLWPLRSAPYAGVDLRILTVNPDATAILFRQDFARTLFGVLGLDESNFVRYDSPTIIPHTLIPAPALAENQCVYEEFATFCNEIGARLDTAGAPVYDVPIYLTKQYLSTGVSHLVNEAEVTSILADEGIAVVAPERMSFAHQVGLFINNKVIAGQIGSAFHTGIFAPARRYLCVNYDRQVWSNQILLDRCNGNETAYIYPVDGVCRDTGHWMNNFRLQDPKSTAHSLLRAIRAFHHASSSPRATRLAPASADPRHRLTRPLGVNVARGKPATQSSHSAWSRGQDREADAAGAVSGVLTGHYQFHTNDDPVSWWQLDLLHRHQITGFSVFNREDNAPGRASHIRLLTSQDGNTWQECSRRDVDEPFGGKDGEPWSVILPAPVPAQFIRIELLRQRHLHLDQVEVFGLLLDELDAVLAESNL